MDLHASNLAPQMNDSDFAPLRKPDFTGINEHLLTAQDLSEAQMNDMTYFDDGPSLGRTPDNDTIPAGYTYFGQMIAHDMSSFRMMGDLAQPTLELHTLYGAGPVMNSYLYWFYPKRGDYTYGGVKFRLDSYKGPMGKEVSDLTRLKFKGDNPTTRSYSLGSPHYALIGDSRNDQNFILSQLTVAWMRFHNAMAEHMHQIDPTLEGNNLFRKTRDQVMLHYQWLVVYDYLRKLVGQKRFDRLAPALSDLNADRFALFQVTQPPRLMPEFTSAAFRIGHSQVRSKYQLVKDPDKPPYMQERLPIYSQKKEPDLRGYVRKTDRGIDWRLFFQFKDEDPPIHSKSIDRNIARELANLIFEPKGKKNLAKRDDRQSVRNVAASGSYRSVLDPHHKPKSAGPSLWYYLLYEAERTSAGNSDTLLNGKPESGQWPNLDQPLTDGGKCLGILGSQIVAEQIFWVLRYTPVSIFKDTTWQNNSPFREKLLDGSFTMSDILTMAGYQYPA